jgi:hypothetical protein
MFCINLDFGGMGGELRQHDVIDAINYRALIIRQDKIPPEDNRNK